MRQEEPADQTFTPHNRMILGSFLFDSINFLESAEHFQDSCLVLEGLKGADVQLEQWNFIGVGKKGWVIIQGVEVGQ